LTSHHVENFKLFNSTVATSPPQSVVVTDFDPSSLEVSWQPPPEADHNGVITGYVIQYTRVGTSDTMSVTITSGTTHTISGLVAFVEYSVEVAAMTVNGTGPFSNAIVQVSGQDSELTFVLLTKIY